MPKGPQDQKRVIGKRKRLLGKRLVDHLKAQGGDIQLRTDEIMALTRKQLRSTRKRHPAISG